MTDLTRGEIQALRIARHYARQIRKGFNFRRYVRRMRRIDPRWGSRQEGLV
jgi:hypothetical protein